MKITYFSGCFSLGLYNFNLKKSMEADTIIFRIKKNIKGRNIRNKEIEMIALLCPTFSAKNYV